MRTYKVTSEVWIYPGMQGNWHFVALSKKQSAEIDKKFGAKKRGWGSLPVVAKIGKTSWKTSIFPEKREQAYILPLKAEVRKKEGVRHGDRVTFSIGIRVQG